MKTIQSIIISGLIMITNFNLYAQNGAYITYYENGNPKEVGFKNEKGVIYGECTYYRKDGSIDGKITFNDQGETQGPFEMYFRNGQLQTKSSYSGKGFYQMHGLYEDYYQNGQLRSKGTYENGKQIGHWVEYFDTGETQSLTAFTNEGIIQKCKTYYKNGQLRMNAVYNKKGDTKDTFLLYYENGQTRSQFYYDGKGNKIGTHTSYYPNGQIMEIGDYAGVDYFQKKGKWKTFYENGDLQTEVEYDKNGKRISKIKQQYQQKITTIQKHNIVGKWKLNRVESGFFPKENVLFEKIKNKKEDYFEFKADGTIAHYIGDYEIECAVGLFSVKEGHWKLQNNLLTIELKGEVFADYLYWWIVEYNVKTEDNKMHLTVQKVIKNKELPASSTWEELIKE